MAHPLQGAERSNVDSDALPKGEPVIKMIECNGQPVVTLSDSPGKVVSTEQHDLAWVRRAFDVPE